MVRFTTFFYHFTLVFDSDAKEKFVDWFGYGATVSVKALEEFEKEYGYALRPEDIVCLLYTSLMRFGGLAIAWPFL